MKNCVVFVVFALLALYHHVLEAKSIYGTVSPIPLIFMNNSDTATYRRGAQLVQWDAFSTTAPKILISKIDPKYFYWSGVQCAEKYITVALNSGFLIAIGNTTKFINSTTDPLHTITCNPIDSNSVFVVGSVPESSPTLFYLAKANIVTGAIEKILDLPKVSNWPLIDSIFYFQNSNKSVQLFASFPTYTADETSELFVIDVLKAKVSTYVFPKHFGDVIITVPVTQSPTSTQQQKIAGVANLKDGVHMKWFEAVITNGVSDVKILKSVESSLEHEGSLFSPPVICNGRMILPVSTDLSLFDHVLLELDLVSGMVVNKVDLFTKAFHLSGSAISCFQK